jgi:ssRNA-specific RNase YbeY (16S rRNA maturation enzyme)
MLAITIRDKRKENETKAFKFEKENELGYTPYFIHGYVHLCGKSNEIYKAKA